MEEQLFSVQSELTQLLEKLALLQVDSTKFDEGNGAAGKRIRLSLAKLRQDMQSLRFKIQEVKNQRKAEKQTAKD
jgi:hypothetical protein